MAEKGYHGLKYNKMLSLNEVFNLARAREDLVKGLTETEAFKYAFGSILVLSFFNYLPPCQEQTDYPIEYMFWLFFLLVTAAGYRESYIANGGANGVDFLPRVACLGWVIGCLLVLPVFLLLVTFLVVASIIGIDFLSIE